MKNKQNHVTDQKTPSNNPQILLGKSPHCSEVTSIFVEKALKLALPDADMVIVEHQLQDAQDYKMLPGFL